MSPSAFSLPPDLFSSKPLLSTRAFRELLSTVWRENQDAPGTGALREDALRAVPAIVHAMDGPDPRHVDRLAWLLGLIAEARDLRGDGVLFNSMREHLGSFLNALKRNAGAASDGQGMPIWNGLLCLLGHFHHDATRVMARITPIAGRDSQAVQVLGAIFDNAEKRPERSKFLLTYLGANASGSALDAGWETCESALVCPSCQGALEFHDDHISCKGCSALYRWSGGIPDLVAQDCADPEQYPASVVEIYETHSRPRFVQVMAGDWSGAVTPAREEAYLARHLHPVDGPVVDLACGAGGWTRMVARQVGASNVIALDYSIAMLNACQHAVPGISLVRGSASALPFADASLGGLNCSDALQALPDPVRAFSEASRCLRPGAPMTVFTFREAKPPYSYFQHRLPTNGRLLFSDAQIREMASNARMDVVDMGGPGRAMFFTLRKRA
jgi:SAM-dependent methyltransferase